MLISAQKDQVRKNIYTSLKTIIFSIHDKEKWWGNCTRKW